MVDDLIEIRDDGTVLIAVHAQPGAGRSGVVGRHGHALKIKVAAPPEGGRANEACAEVLAEALGVKRNQVELLTGPASRSKRFAVTGAEPGEVRAAVERLLRQGNTQPGVGVRDRRRDR